MSECGHSQARIGKPAAAHQMEHFSSSWSASSACARDEKSAPAVAMTGPARHALSANVDACACAAPLSTARIIAAGL